MDRSRGALIAGLAVAALAVLVFLPPIPQSLCYHTFADQRIIWGVPNFWNVVSNFPFLLVALWGLRALRSPVAFLESWERAAYCILLVGVALIAFGSGYYHLRPNNGTLFWDRLPMAIVFMSLLATTIGERISERAGRLLLVPLVALGAASVLYWMSTDDLRLYAVVQYYPMAAVPLMLVLFPPRYSGSSGVYAMAGVYAIAKILELLDHQMAAISPAGGHPWKHVAAAAAMLCYVATVARRRPLRL
jgi:hypothetical protein